MPDRCATSAPSKASACQPRDEGRIHGDKDLGLEGLQDRSRRPYRHANQLPFQVERAIVALRRERPSWGAAKIREKLIRNFPMVPTPAKSTIHAVLDRHGLVEPRKRRRHKAEGTALSDTRAPNGLWCADYKGEFMRGNRKYCYPLTVSDYSSRFLLACEGLESTQSTFAAPNALFGLSRLAVWWLQLGIRLERIKPGQPQQNGRHERLHLALKKEATKPASFNFLQQQSRFDEFVAVYSARTKRSTCATQASSIHLHLELIGRLIHPNIRSTIVPFASRNAVVSASAGARSISAMLWPANSLEFARSPTRSGLSASCSTI